MKFETFTELISHYKTLELNEIYIHLRNNREKKENRGYRFNLARLKYIHFDQYITIWTYQDNWNIKDELTLQTFRLSDIKFISNRF